MVVEHAHVARRIAAPASAEWIEASAYLVRCDCRDWVRLDELERVARETIDAAARVRRSGGDPRRTLVDVFGLATARHLAQIHMDLATLLQSRGEHYEAIGHLSFLFDELLLQAGRIPQNLLVDLLAEAGLASAQSLHALGRGEEALAVLSFLRAECGDRKEGALAAALLTMLPVPELWYEGKYSGDSPHAALREKVRSAIEPAARRMAQRVGIERSALPEFCVGVADKPRGLDSIAALTGSDPRCPALIVPIVIFAESLGLGRKGVETVLVHELVHAWLECELGPRAESMPGWVEEGLAMAFAGELETSAEARLEQRFIADPAGFLAPDYWERHPLELEDDGSRIVPADAFLLVLPLVESNAGRGAELFVERITAGESFESLLSDLTGLELDAYERAAHARALDFLDERRADAAGPLAVIEAARSQGDATGLQYIEEVCLGADFPPLARAWTLFARADLLSGLGRHEEASRAWRALAEERADHSPFLTKAVLEEARCFARAGKVEGARALYRSLQLSATRPEFLELLDREITKLGAAPGRPRPP